MKVIATAEHAMAFTYSDRGGNGAESRCVDCVWSVEKEQINSARVR